MNFNQISWISFADLKPKIDLINFFFLKKHYLYTLQLVLPKVSEALTSVPITNYFDFSS